MLRVGEFGCEIIASKKYFFFVVEDRAISVVELFEHFDREFCKQTLESIGYHAVLRELLS